MPARPAGKRDTYHARVLVTRMEDWWVDACSADEAKALLQAGEGHRCSSGDLVWVELRDLRAEQ
jgi:hypothetical protein